MDIDKALARFTSYDLFARLIAGAIAAFSFDYFKVFTWYSGVAEKPSVWQILLVAYFLGMVLEELLWIFNCAAHAIESLIKKVFSSCKKDNKSAEGDGAVKSEPNDTSSSVHSDTNPKLDDLEYTRQRDRLLVEGHGSLIDNAQMHYVMSGSLGIAFCIITVTCAFRLLHFSIPCLSGMWDTWKKVIFLAALTLLFGQRYYHYRDRRHDLVRGYYEALYGDKTKPETNKAEQASQVTRHG